jgi:hypothetical protein
VVCVDVYTVQRPLVMVNVEVSVEVSVEVKG